MQSIQVAQDSALRLPTVTVGRASAFRARLVGIPRDLERVQIAFGTPKDNSSCAVQCDPRPGGEWTAYASGAYFLVEGRASYHVTALTPRGDSVYLGAGTLFIVPSVLNVEETALPVIPPDCYVRGADGLYYKVTAELDEDGLPYMVVDRKGVSM